MNSNAPLAEWRRSRGRSLRLKEMIPWCPLHPFKAGGPMCQRGSDGKASVHNTGKLGNFLSPENDCWLIHCGSVSCSAFSLSQTASLLLLPADPFENMGVSFTNMKSWTLTTAFSDSSHIQSITFAQHLFAFHNPGTNHSRYAQPLCGPFLITSTKMRHQM